MKLSFIIPTYNCEKYIKKCLNSILNQKTNIKYEIIIVDDGSKDNTKKEVSKFLNKYSKVKYYFQKHKGVSYARNFGISKSVGEYISFVDADDIISENFFVNLEKEFQKDFDILKTKVECLDLNKYDGRFELPIFNKLNGSSALLKFCKKNKIFAIPWSYIIKRDYFLKNKFRFKTNSLYEDYLLIPLVLAKADNIRSVNWYGYIYIKRNSSTTTSFTDALELQRINDFIFNTYLLIKYFYDNKYENYQQICSYFYERLSIKISHLSLDIKMKMNIKTLDKIEQLNNNIQCNVNIEELPQDYYLAISEAINSAKFIFKSNLISIILGGSCGKNNPIPGWSDVDLYIILKEYNPKTIRIFNNTIKNNNMHIGLTFYSLLEIDRASFDGKTKIMLYEKQNFNVNPTLYGFCYIRKIYYKEIILNDYINLPNIIHEFRRMYVDLIDKETFDKKYIKKLLVLIKCYLNTKGIFLYGYENVVMEFLKIYNKNSTKRYKFDIMDSMTCAGNSRQKLLNFSEKVLAFVIKDMEE